MRCGARRPMEVPPVPGRSDSTCDASFPAPEGVQETKQCQTARSTALLAPECSMAVFVTLDDEDGDPPDHHDPIHKTIWPMKEHHESAMPDRTTEQAESHDASEIVQKPIALGRALACYPVAASIASCIDLTTLDNLSRTCRSVRWSLLQYRNALIKSTLHCSNDSSPVEDAEVLRFRARAGSWLYMEDVSRPSKSCGKAGRCARDMVSECRRCGDVICRNCAIKPPAPIVLRDRLRRLCLVCQKVPINLMVQPHLLKSTSLESDLTQLVICGCASGGVWLCQPCGRGIRSRDSMYKGIWRWRSQYGEVLGGLGTGIGDADRGVECGNRAGCLGGRYIEQESDCDAEDARDAEFLASGVTPSGSPELRMFGGNHRWENSSASSNHSHSSRPSNGRSSSNSSLPMILPDHISDIASIRTPSPSMGPGYSRHEIEGIGGVMKKVRLRMVRVGACVPEWEDERSNGQILGRELGGKARSHCDWCCRIVPSTRDYELDRMKHRTDGNEPIQ